MKEWSYSLTTNTIWFSKDYGTVQAKNHAEAEELAREQITADVAEMNRRLNGFATIEVNLDELSVEQTVKYSIDIETMGLDGKPHITIK